MLDFAIAWLHHWAEIMPLPWFTFLGAILEEIIVPIPSPLVMTLGGSLAASVNSGVAYLLLLALTGTAGKSIGSYGIYLVADKFENVVAGRWGKYIGISHQQIEAIGKRLGKGWKDNIVIFILRALPIMPTAPVSFVAGLLKMDVKGYVISTALGVFVRNIFYLYLGYTSLGALEKINENLASSESIGSLIVLILIAGLIYYIYRKRRELWKEAPAPKTIEPE